MHLYKHNKTGHIYLQICKVLDCTNGRDDEVHALYIRPFGKHSSRKIYTREINEFKNKFTKLI
jgi:hypothetical protein